MRMKDSLLFPPVAPVKPIVATRSKDRRNRNHTNGATYYLGSWITARRCGRCVKCGGDIIHGDTVKWIPASRRLLCYSCGQSEGQAILPMMRGGVV